MKWKDYAADRLVQMLLFFILAVFVFFFLIMFKVPSSLITAIGIVFFLFGTILFSYDYYQRKSFYNDFLKKLEQLDKKCLITELVDKPGFLEGKILCNALYEIDKSMYEEIERYKNSIEDFKEYVEMWIHEVKIPIASTTLILHNHKPDGDKKIKEQIKRIENYVEQVLYFVRGENSEKDYLIKACNLEEIIKNVIKRNKDSFLLKKIRIEMEEVNQVVLSDSKWIEYIINQVVSNSIKYSRETDGRIIFRTKVFKSAVLLEIEDNGVGIYKKDISKVFEKSFTGENGRMVSGSTGMGLYLAKKLCDKLGHNITLISKKDSYTKVSIFFQNDNYYNVI